MNKMSKKMESMTGAKALMTAMEKEGVKEVFGIPGGANLPMYDEFARCDIRHILARHEQSAAHMADGFGRVSRKPGVCFATSGPGATNILTGYDCSYWSSTSCYDWKRCISGI